MLPSSKTHEWKHYAIADSFSVPNEYVFHVCHADDALRIFEDGEIRPSLVSDESKLRTTRTVVTWLSPNHWTNGFRYGNVAFKFEWKRLIEGRRLYWVEAIDHYRPPAFRILITDDEPTIPLERYVAERDGGPLCHDHSDDVWSRSSRYTAEFLFDGTLSLSECRAVLFVDHHPDMCCKNPPCNDLGKQGHKCGARLLARLMAQHHVHHLRRLFRKHGSRELHRSSAAALQCLLRSLSVDKAKAGKIRHAHSAAPQLACAILDRYGARRRTAALCNLFRNTDELRRAINARAAHVLGISASR